MRFYPEHDTTPRLTGLVRMDVFGTVETRTRRGKVKTVGAGWQAWNADPRLETATARLSRQGSFYWHGAISAYAEAKRILRDDPRVHQIKLETISGVEIGRIYR